MPLPPASCAKDAMGAISVTKNAKAKNADLPNIDHTPVRQCNEPAGLLFLHPTRGMISRSGIRLPAGGDIAALLARGLFQSAICLKYLNFRLLPTSAARAIGAHLLPWSSGPALPSWAKRHPAS